MKALGLLLATVALLSVGQLFSGCTKKETSDGVSDAIDLKALAKKARPAVMLLVVSDAAGKEIVTGTGFLVSSDGKLITNHHVVKNAASAVAKAEEGSLFTVEGVLADNPKKDLVLLKLKPKKRDIFDDVADAERKKRGLPSEPVTLDFPFLPLGNTDKVEAGTRIALIGSPLGLEGTLSEGIVSAMRDLSSSRVLQITAPVSPGSSGSPVLDSKGAVIGVAAAMLIEGQLVNFAIPVESVKEIMQNSRASREAIPLWKFGKNSDDLIRSTPEFRTYVEALDKKDFRIAFEPVKRLVARFPEVGFAHFILGVVYNGLEFYPEAVAEFQESVKLSNDRQSDLGARGSLAEALERSGRNKEAEQVHAERIKMDSNASNIWLDRGDFYARQGKLDQAIADYQKATTLGSGSHELVPVNEKGEQTGVGIFGTWLQAKAWYNMGICYARLGKHEEAWKSVPHLNNLNAEMAKELISALKAFSATTPKAEK